MNCSENPPAAPKKKGMSTGCIIACAVGGVFLIPGLLGIMEGALFGNKELPPRDPSKPPIVYLMP